MNCLHIYCYLNIYILIDISSQFFRPCVNIYQWSQFCTFCCIAYCYTVYCLKIYGTVFRIIKYCGASTILVWFQRFLNIFPKEHLLFFKITLMLLSYHQSVNFISNTIHYLQLISYQNWSAAMQLNQILEKNPTSTLN